MKSLMEMNLIDSFIFSCSTENIKDAEFIAKLIIERVTGQKIDTVVVETEKQLKGINVDKRGIRMDLCVSQMENGKVARVYDIEPNAYRQVEIFQRSRFYQSHADINLLNTGESFGNLPEYISIWILSYDPFGKDRMIYHVKNMVEESPEICYNDGAARLYLYTKGNYGGTEKLKSLLRFLEKSTEENATDEELMQLYRIIDRIRKNEKVGERYMIFKSGWDYELEEEAEKLANERVEQRVEQVLEQRVEQVVEQRVEQVLEQRVEQVLEQRVEQVLEQRVEQVVEQQLIEVRVKEIISVMREFNADDEAIVEALMKKCSLTECEAREKLAGK